MMKLANSKQTLLFWTISGCILALDLKLTEATSRPRAKAGCLINVVDNHASNSFWRAGSSTVVGWRIPQSSIRRLKVPISQVPRGGDLSWSSSTPSSETDEGQPTERNDLPESTANEDGGSAENSENDTTSVEQLAGVTTESVVGDDEDEGSVTPLDEPPVDGSDEGTPKVDPPTQETAAGNAEELVAKIDSTDDPNAPDNVMDGTEQTLSSTFEAAVQDDPTLDDNDSAAYVDRMELADDEGGETTPGGFEIESHRDAEATSSTAAPSATVTMSGGDSSAEAETCSIAGTEVSKDMEEVLIKELHYTKDEVASMNPGHAAVAVQKRLWRPWEGMPPSWYKPGHSPTSHGARKFRKIIPKLVLSGLIGAVVVRSSLNGQLDVTDLLTAVSSLKERFLTPASLLPKAASAPSKQFTTVERVPFADESDTDSAQVSTAPSTQPMTHGSDPLPVNEHVNALGEPHAHSIRPGLEPSNEDELDVTWLDKAITSIARKLRSLFGRK